MAAVPTFFSLAYGSMLLLGFFFQGDRQVGIAGGERVDEGLASAIAFRGVEGQAALDAVGEAGEAGLAVGVGAEFEIEFVEAAEAVGDMDPYFRGVDGGASGVCDCEVGGAGAGRPVEHRDGFGIGGRRLSDGCGGESEREEGEGWNSHGESHWVHSQLRLRFSLLACLSIYDSPESPRISQETRDMGHRFGLDRKPFIRLALGVPVTNVHCPCMKVPNIIF